MPRGRADPGELAGEHLEGFPALPRAFPSLTGTSPSRRGTVRGYRNPIASAGWRGPCQEGHRGGIVSPRAFAHPGPEQPLCLLGLPGILGGEEQVRVARLLQPVQPEIGPAQPVGCLAAIRVLRKRGHGLPEPGGRVGEALHAVQRPPHVKQHQPDAHRPGGLPAKRIEAGQRLRVGARVEPRDPDGKRGPLGELRGRCAIQGRLEKGDCHGNARPAAHRSSPWNRSIRRAGGSGEIPHHALQVVQQPPAVPASAARGPA